MDFPQPHIQLPIGSHTHTIILLHGRDSNGAEFAEELFSSKSSKDQSLFTALPTWRWVFLTSRDRWSDRFQENMCSWFDAYSLDDIHQRQDLQIDGLRESISYVLDIIESEIKILRGKARHLYLGGISQGMATGLCALFCATGRSGLQGPLGGFLGFCGWLPFTQQVEALIEQRRPCGSPEIQYSVSKFFLDTLSSNAKAEETKTQTIDLSILSTPVFISHGVDDTWVSVELGRQAYQILKQILVHAEWHKFSGAEGDGHWIKEPEGFDQILEFLEDSVAQRATSAIQ